MSRLHEGRQRSFVGKEKALVRLVVCPHLDDAALSVGDHLSEWCADPCVVLTAFAGIPGKPVISEYDARSAFKNSREAMATRRRENGNALAVFGVTHVRNGDFLESAYVTEPGDPAAVERLIEDAVMAFTPDELTGPLGLHHSDHLLLGEAFRRVAFRSSLPTLIYEDLPYRVNFPREVEPALDRWRWAAFEPKFVEEERESGTAAKRAAVACYESQLWAIDGPALYCPERLWRVR